MVVIMLNQGRLTTLEGKEAPAVDPFKRKMEYVMRNLKKTIHNYGSLCKRHLQEAQGADVGCTWISAGS